MLIELPETYANWRRTMLAAIKTRRAIGLEPRKGAPTGTRLREATELRAIRNGLVYRFAEPR